MIERVLLAVDDSPDSLAAARLTIELAATTTPRIQIRALHVSTDHLLDAALEAASGRPAGAIRRKLAAASVLTRVAALAEAAGIHIETELRSGEVGPTILEAARHWPADLIILGKSARSGSGHPYVGAQTRHVLEFADQPVLVVPPARHAA